jgi:hypothetical protein
MTLNVSISDSLQLAGVTAMANEYRARTGEPVTDEQYLQSQVEAVCLGYASAYRIGIVSSGDFVLRFTPQEFFDINTAAATDPHIAGFMNRIREVGSVTLYSPETVSGMQYLVERELVTQERAAEILSWVAPQPVFPEPEPEPEPIDPPINPEPTE